MWSHSAVRLGDSIKARNNRFTEDREQDQGGAGSRAQRERIPAPAAAGALLTAGAGIGYGILTILAWLALEDARRRLVDQADGDTGEWGGAVLGADIAALYLLPFAAILFLWFIVALRAWIRGTQLRRNLLISDIQFASGAVFTAIFLVGAGALATSVTLAGAGDADVSADSLRGLVGFANTVVTVMGVRIAAIFVIATASLGMSTGSTPRWFNLASYVFGVVLILTPVVDQILILAFPTCVIALSILLLVHISRLRTDQLPGFAARFEGPESESSGGVG